MEIETKIGKEGRIVGGEYAGFRIRIVDDSKKSGGFLILTWKGDPEAAFDDWVRDIEDLKRFLRESGWVIEWPE